MGGSFSYWRRVVGIVLGLFAILWHPSPEWVESAYVNGVYPGWEHFIHAIGQPSPWSIGDFAGLLGIVLVLACIVRAIRGRSWVPLVDLVAVAGLYAFWFEAAWGWNYNRAPIETRLAFDAKRVDHADVVRLRARAVEEINRLAPVAHLVGPNESLDIDALYADWLPVVQRGGDDWTPTVGAPKPTIADRFMQLSGTTGYINPLTLSSHLASDLLWFERPFSLSHEWTHVAGYAREDEANYVAIVTCTRSKDPAVQYSGWLELFLYLPPLKKYPRTMFVPLVWRDFDAIRQRNAHHMNVDISRWSWRTYNTYLKSNHVAAGIENYNEVTRLILGIPLDASGLPIAAKR